MPPYTYYTIQVGGCTSIWFSVSCFLDPPLLFPLSYLEKRKKRKASNSAAYAALHRLQVKCAEALHPHPSGFPVAPEDALCPSQRFEGSGNLFLQ